MYSAENTRRSHLPDIILCNSCKVVMKIVFLYIYIYNVCIGKLYNIYIYMHTCICACTQLYVYNYSKHKNAEGWVRLLPACGNQLSACRANWKCICWMAFLIMKSCKFLSLKILPIEINQEWIIFVCRKTLKLYFHEIK